MALIERPGPDTGGGGNEAGPHFPHPKLQVGPMCKSYRYRLLIPVQVVGCAGTGQLVSL